MPAFVRAAYPSHGDGEPRVLILVHLEGGNDGWSTVVPFHDDNYYRLRPTLSLRRNELVVLSETAALARAAAPLEALFKDGRLAIVQNVGYLNQSESHYRSSEIWQTGSGADEVLYSGWAGRCISQLEASGRAVTASYSSVRLPRVLVREEDRPGRAMSTQDWRRRLTQRGDSPAAAFAEVAECAAASRATEIYFLSVPGFDTHYEQASRHAARWHAVAKAVCELQSRLERRGVAPRVLTLMFSEFGRSAAENVQGGTDHGGGAPVFAFGAAVRGGFYHEAPVIASMVADPAPLDFRAVLTTVARQWLRVSPGTILGREFGGIDFLNPANVQPG